MWFLGLYWHFEICFLSTPRQMPQTITNIPRCLPQILTVPKFWYHLAHSFSRKNVPFDFERAFWEAEGALSKPKGPFFRENEAQEMTPKLLALAKVCSVLGNIRDVSWHLSKRGSELEKRWTFSYKACITRVPKDFDYGTDSPAGTTTTTLRKTKAMTKTLTVFGSDIPSIDIL